MRSSKLSNVEYSQYIHRWSFVNTRWYNIEYSGGVMHTDSELEPGGPNFNSCRVRYIPLGASTLGQSMNLIPHSIESFFNSPIIYCPRVFSEIIISLIDSYFIIFPEGHLATIDERSIYVMSILSPKQIENVRAFFSNWSVKSLFKSIIHPLTVFLKTGN